MRPEPVLSLPPATATPQALRRWWRQQSPSTTERYALLERWLAGALHERQLSGKADWRWFGDRPIPQVEPVTLPIATVLALGELWQTAGEGPDKANGQWFTPPDLVARLLTQWACDWLADQQPSLMWDGQRLCGSLAVPQAHDVLARWQALRVIDPAMGAGDWLCGWFQLHQALGRALAAHCGESPPAIADSLATLHGIDRDARAVALAEIRLALLGGQAPPTHHLLVGDSLIDADRLWPAGTFDLVLGNPPYVGTRGLAAASNRQALQARYGYADDLYVHFVDRGLQALKPSGWLLLILSDTFRTTVTKARLRQCLLAHALYRIEPLPATAFAATVATVAVTVQRQTPRDTVLVPPHAPIPLAELRLGPRDVFVDPSAWHRRRLASLRPHWEPLLNAWADVLQNARRQREAETAIARHRRSLRPGDWSLLGLLCDGGVGLQTGDNSAALAVRADSEAGEAALRRQEALAHLWHQNPLVAPHVPDLPAFDDRMSALRQRFSAAQLGLRRGEVWRVVAASDVADPLAWPEAWRALGRPGEAVWVPYEKGDPDGRRWVHANPFLIRWDRAAVQALQQSGRGRGAPVMRNPQFFFRPGVTWSNMSSRSLKARLQPPCVYDVGSMTLLPAVTWLDPLLLVAWLNAAPTTAIIKAYVNHTLNFQINDLRLLPVRVPDEATAARLRHLAATAVDRGVGAATDDVEAAVSALVGDVYGPVWADDSAPGG